MSREDQAAAAIREVMDQLMQHTPLKAWLEFQGPLRYGDWARRLATHPTVLAEFKPLVFDDAGKRRYGLRSDEMERIFALVDMHPVLHDIAEKEWRQSHA